MKPEYKFYFTIKDESTDALLVSGSSQVSTIDENGSCESIESELFSNLRAFNKLRDKYETEVYSTDQRTDDMDDDSDDRPVEFVERHIPNFN